MNRRFIAALSVVPVLAVGALHLTTGVAGSEAAAPPLPQTVSITVELDLPVGNIEGPDVYQVTDVPVVAGPELTAANLLKSPANWCGSLTVNVDNVARTITVAPDKLCNFQTATVKVTGEGIDSLTTVSDTLWFNQENCAMVLTQATAAGGVASIAWNANPTAENCDVTMAEGGAAVFSYETVPSTTTTGTPTTEAPTTELPAAKAVAGVRPAFTG